jgi:hypothetical protein
VLVEEIDVIDLLERAAGEAGLVLDQILQIACVEMASPRSTGLYQVQSAPAHMA